MGVLWVMLDMLEIHWGILRVLSNILCLRVFCFLLACSTLGYIHNTLRYIGITLEYIEYFVGSLVGVI